MEYKLDWDLLNLPGATFACGVRDFVTRWSKTNIPYLIELLPFRHSVHCYCYIEEPFIMVKCVDRLGEKVFIDDIKDIELVNAGKHIFERTPFPTFEDMVNHLPKECFNNETFTYIGSYVNQHASWGHLIWMLYHWLQIYSIPHIENLNRIRVIQALPESPKYNLQQVLNNIFVLESESAMIQGTCFNLEGVGLVTCEHVLADDLYLFRPNDINTKYPVRIIASNSTIDIAIIEADGLEVGKGLIRGSSDNVIQMNQIAIAGFPNYRYGDSGILSPGFVIGFRMLSGIRRILVNTPIIGGNSGGPALDQNGKIIGVAATGADRMEEATETENHGIVPVDTLDLL